MNSIVACEAVSKVCVFGAFRFSLVAIEGSVATGVVEPLQRGGKKKEIKLHGLHIETLVSKDTILLAEEVCSITCEEPRAIILYALDEKRALIGISEVESSTFTETYWLSC